MCCKVEVREGETIRSAIQRLRWKVSDKFSRSWYKSRVGYYEKPSVRKRRKQGTATLNRKPGQRTLKMKMGLVWLYKRKRPWP